MWTVYQAMRGPSTQFGFGAIWIEGEMAEAHDRMRALGLDPLSQTYSVGPDWDYEEVPDREVQVGDSPRWALDYWLKRGEPFPLDLVAKADLVIQAYRAHSAKVA